jgi:hypothetical protein
MLRRSAKQCAVDDAKTPERQSVLMLHRIRLMLVCQRTLLINTIRATWRSSVVAPIGRHGLDGLLAVLLDLDDERVPTLARDCLVQVEIRGAIGVLSQSLVE